MNALRKLLAACVVGLTMIGPAVLPTTVQAGHEAPISRHYAVYYRWADPERGGSWVLYGAYNEEASAYQVANWLQANWPYETFIWAY